MPTVAHVDPASFRAFCGVGNVEQLRKLLDGGIDESVLNSTDKYGESGLMVASSSGHTDCVLLLATNGADLNQQDRFGWSALMSAANAGYTPVVEVLLANGAATNLKNEIGKTAIELAEGDHIVALLTREGDVEDTTGELECPAPGCSFRCTPQDMQQHMHDAGERHVRSLVKEVNLVNERCGHTEQALAALQQELADIRLHISSDTASQR